MHLIQIRQTPTDFGWLFEETNKSLSPVIVPRGIAHVLKDILQTIKSQCDIEGPCGTKCCGSNKTQLGCTVFCEPYILNAFHIKSIYMYENLCYLYTESITLMKTKHCPFMLMC